MKSIFNLLLILSFAVLLVLTGCKDDETPEPENPEEVITTLIATFTPASGGSPVEMKWKDLDGDGPDAPVITNGNLAEGTVYNLTISCLNETEPVDITNPEYNITLEIAEEAEEHQFFFQSENGLDLTVAYGDADMDGNPIGLANTATAGAKSTGNLTITLRHEPEKTAAGVKDGDITNAGGETDIEVTFDIEIQ